MGAAKLSWEKFYGAFERERRVLLFLSQKRYRRFKGIGYPKPHPDRAKGILQQRFGSFVPPQVSIEPLWDRYDQELQAPRKSSRTCSRSRDMAIAKASRICVRRGNTADDTCTRAFPASFQPCPSTHTSCPIWARN